MKLQTVPRSDPLVLTLEESARLSNERPAVLRAALLSGELSGYRSGWVWRIPRASLEAWILKRCEELPQARPGRNTRSSR